MSTPRSLPLLDNSTFSTFLAGLADGLDIPEKMYEEATLKYEEVGIWLAEDEQGVGRYSPKIYPQGSFRLGTVVRPANTGCDYDIDLVCHLDLAKEATSQKQLKDLVGERLKEHPDLRSRLSPSRRCWNLSYPKQFHMDVLPAIANKEQIPDGILLTDTDLVRWQKSNPLQYAAWFYKAMAIEFQRRKEELAKAFSANVEDVPDWRVKTPLQRAVQLLKRHRDIQFQGDPEKRPVSIIVTTLAAHAYQNQANLTDALLSIVSSMPRYIENRNGVWWVANPVEPDENFADKWNEKPERRTAFLAWLARLQNDVESVLKGRTVEKAVEVLRPSFGADSVSDARSRFVERFGAVTLVPVIAPPKPLPAITTEVRHCLPASWPMNVEYKVDVRGSLHLKKLGPRIAELSRRRIPKKMWLKFTAQTNAPGAYEVKWQVVNTGLEAASASQLRGDFYASDSNNTRWETTSYSGIHWVEAFVIKDGKCVARSGRKYVTVA